MLLFYEKQKQKNPQNQQTKQKNPKKLLATWLFTVLVKKIMFFSQYPEAGIIIMCFLLHVKLRGDIIADSSSLSEY